MNTLRQQLLSLALAVFVCLIAFPTPSPAAYLYRELPPDVINPEVTALNDAGAVAGSGTVDFTYQGFIYASGTYTPVLPPGHSQARVYGININGAVVGSGVTGGLFRAFISSQGTYAELLPPSWSQTWGRGINGNGWVVGYGLDQNGAYKAFISSQGTYTELLPPSWSDAWGEAINDAGTAVGYGSLSDTSRGFIYKNGAYTELLPPSFSDARAVAINNNDAVAGFGNENTASGAITKAFIYVESTYAALLPPGWEEAQATSLNDANTVAGWGKDGSGVRKGFVYREGAYTEILPPGWQEAVVTSINDAGTVAGWGTDAAGSVKGFTAEPFLSIPLLTGWNFISLPCTPNDTGIEMLLADILTKVRIVWGYDNEHQTWLIFQPQGTNTLTSMEPGKGYWVYMDEPGELNLPDRTAPRTVHLYEGWNLVGYNGPDGAEVSSELNALQGKWDILWTWTSDVWSLKHRSLSCSAIPPLTHLVRGKAYWLRVGRGQGEADWVQ